MTLDDIERPLDPVTIQMMKNHFIREFGSLDRCSCVNCKAQEANNCVLQFDPYNTDGDCLAEK